MATLLGQFFKHPYPSHYSLKMAEDASHEQTAEFFRNAFRSRRLTLLDNVRDITAEQIIAAARPSKKWGIALLAGGPPCQSFSSAGTRRGWKDERGGLVADYVRLLEGLQPRGFLFENVIGFADAVRTTDGTPEPLLDWVLRKAVKAGYAISWGVIDAADYGAPQHRERFIITGSKLEYPPAFPNPTHGPYGVDQKGAPAVERPSCVRTNWTRGNSRGNNRLVNGRNAQVLRNSCPKMAGR